MDVRPVMTDEESERDSIRTGESRELGEELQQDLAPLSLPELRNVVEEMRWAAAAAGCSGSPCQLPVSSPV